MPLWSWRKLAEEQITLAAQRGEFDNLPGAGKPLRLDDDSNLPEELRLAYKMLKTAGFKPPELETRQELLQVEDLLANAPDEKTRYAALKRLNFLTMKLGELRPGCRLLENDAYAERMAERLTRKK